MSWETEAVASIRSKLSDTSATPTYTDSQILTACCDAAKQILIDVTGIGFVNDYTVVISAQTISPDPTETATLDEAFFTLLTLKAACAITYGAAIKTSGQAIRIVDARSEIDLRESYKARMSAAKDGWCQQYKEALNRYIIDARSGGGPNPTGGFGRLVITPVRMV